MLAVASAFLGTVALYWLYFRSVADRAGSRLAAADADRTLVARDIFTYLHVVLVAGVVLVAVGNELVIAHSDEHLLGKEMIALGAGPFVYLLAQNLMRLRAAGSLSLTRSAGMGGIVLATVIGSQLPSLVASALILLVLPLSSSRVSANKSAFPRSRLKLPAM
jgi:low temperature requirement protein LtrA